jgi:hypothetical protein
MLPGGGDWGLFRSDGTLSVDARGCLETDDSGLICVTYGGRWRISPELLVRLGDPGQIDRIDPSDYYLRTLLLFETAAEKYAWLNDIVAVGVGRRTVKGIAYSVHEVRSQLIRVERRRLTGRLSAPYRGDPSEVSGVRPRWWERLIVAPMTTTPLMLAKRDGTGASVHTAHRIRSPA